MDVALVHHRPEVVEGVRQRALNVRAPPSDFIFLLKAKTTFVFWRILSEDLEARLCSNEEALVGAHRGGDVAGVHVAGFVLLQNYQLEKQNGPNLPTIPSWVQLYITSRNNAKTIELIHPKLTIKEWSYVKIS
jgi:hypothetical protein